jgi:hypothetical protein
VVLFALGASGASGASGALVREHKHHKRPPSKPTKAEINAAVKRAKRSHKLWATVNICDTAAHSNVLGIRGQVPALGFATSMSMLVQVDYYVAADGRFEPDTSVPPVRVPLGKKPEATGLWQGGLTFTFTPPAVLSGTVTFQWKLGKKVIGHVTKLTAHGIKGVADSDPPGFSTATCTISTP